MKYNNEKYYITLQEIFDEDWKTQLARGYPPIPKGEKVLYISTWGNFVRIKWNNTIYDTYLWKLKEIKNAE